jgi:hypothetical protein
MRLELFLESLIQLRQLLLPFAFRLFAKRAFDLATFLQVSRLVLIARFRVEPQARLAKRGIDFELHLLPPKLFALAQQLPLPRVHLKPAFGVLPQHLLIFGRKVHSAIG